ncbi:MAG: SPOR domain-containing protein [Bacteroidota bacterium]|nr:SPOR domain-containing protein [Bacteroidota bacterium]
MKRFVIIGLSIFCFLIFIPFSSYSQRDGLNDTLIQAENLFKTNEFVKAIPFYEHLDKQYPDTVYFQYKLGVCYLEKSDFHSKALQYLKKVENKNPAAPELNYFLGRAFHMNYDFDSAIDYFTKSLEEYKSKDARYKEVNRYIKNCESGMELHSNPRYVNITNIGSPINTDGVEYGPAISSSGNMLIYTYRGKSSKGGLQNGEYRDDIMISKKLENGLWSAPLSLGDKVNTEGNEASISISPDEQQLFIYKYTPENRGDIYVSKFNILSSLWSEPTRLEGKVNTEFWEGSCSLTPDGKTLYFVSTRIGGYGGKDIWKAFLQDDGTWGKVENLGPEINTEFDEDGPFLYPNGKVLFFGSNGHNSMGGMDIFQSDLSEEGYWSLPINLGYPINTVTNDIYYTISSTGRGYYSSEKKGGYGKQDIYVVDPGFVGKSIVMALVKGTVTTNGKPEGAEIFVTDAKGNEMNEIFRSSSENGNYVLTLLPGNEYNITYMAENGTEEIRKVSTMEVDSFTIMEINVDFNTYVSEKLNKAYENAIKNGDEAFKNEDYLNAIVYYSQAIGYNPDKQYPKDQIVKARELLNKKLKNGEELVINDFQDNYQGNNNARQANSDATNTANTSNVSNASSDNKDSNVSTDKKRNNDFNPGKIILTKSAINVAEDPSIHFSLQIAATLKKDKAEVIYKKFKNRGYDISIQQVTFTDAKEDWYRLRIGTYKSLDLAINEAKKLLKEPLPDAKVWIDISREDKLTTTKNPYHKTHLLNQD